MKKFNTQGREIYEFNLNQDQLSTMNRRATRNRRHNSKMIAEASLHVGGNPDAPLLDAEYMANAEAQKVLREEVYGRNRDFVKARTKELEMAGEIKALDIHPIAWKREKIDPVPKPKTWIDRFFDWINSLQDKVKLGD